MAQGQFQKSLLIFGTGTLLFPYNPLNSVTIYGPLYYLPHYLPFPKKGKSHNAHKQKFVLEHLFFLKKNAGSGHQQCFLCMKILSQMEVAPRCQLFSLFTLYKQLWSKKRLLCRERDFEKIPGYPLVCYDNYSTNAQCAVWAVCFPSNRTSWDIS